METGQQSVLHTQIPYQDALNAYGQALQTSLEQRPVGIDNVSFAEKDGQIVLNADKQYTLLSVSHTVEGCQITGTFRDHVVQFNFPEEDYSRIVEQIQATVLQQTGVELECEIKFL